MPIVDPDLVGEVDTPALPFKEQAHYGHAELTPAGAFEVRSMQSFKLIYTAGPYGIDDTGAIRIAFRFAMDSGALQTDDPAGVNYVTAHTGNGVPLNVVYHPASHTRPRNRALTIHVTGGHLAQGDQITVVFGDTSKGSPGMQLQTFCESALEFKVLVDVFATGHFVPLGHPPSIQIVPGMASVWKAVVPTLRKCGDSFALGIKAEDRWGNPSDQVAESLTITSNLPIENLPESIEFPIGKRALRIDKLKANTPGIYRIRVFNAQGHHLADANPLVVKTDTMGGYWGDLHGQTGETVAINTAREYFTFARDLAFLDVASHQGNDFQIKDRFWRHLNELTAEFNAEGRFVTFPGYEWSGNTAVGGDHNVYFRHEGRTIRRSSHALLTDRSNIETDANTLKELFTALRDEDCVVYAHVGGRYADPSYAHDPRIETAMEIHSDWGTFEWLLTDGFALGHRCGVVCNSDGHKGRPGASYPGAASFGAYGGLTCFLTGNLSRDAVFDCLRRRHHYGTTGNRLYLDVRTVFRTHGRFFERDPRVYATSARKVDQVMMGDIAQTDDATIDMKIAAVTHTPIERIDILNGKTVVQTVRGYDAGDLGHRIRIIWSGANYRGRSRKTRWQGSARLENAKILRMAKINAWNPERPFEQRGSHCVTWDTITTGNFSGCDIWIEEQSGARLQIDTNLVSGTIDLDRIGLEDTVFDAGGLDRHIRVFRLPEVNSTLELNATVAVPLNETGDTPLWVRVTTEDGFNAWSSPMFIYRDKDSGSRNKPK